MEITAGVESSQRFLSSRLKKIGFIFPIHHKDECGQLHNSMEWYKRSPQSNYSDIQVHPVFVSNAKEITSSASPPSGLRVISSQDIQNILQGLTKVFQSLPNGQSVTTTRLQKLLQNHNLTPDQLITNYSSSL